MNGWKDIGSRELWIGWIPGMLILIEFGLGFGFGEYSIPALARLVLTYWS